MKHFLFYGGIALTVSLTFTACVVAKTLLDKPEGLLVVDELNNPFLSINRPPEKLKHKERIVLEVRRINQ